MLKFYLLFYLQMIFWRRGILKESELFSVEKDWMYRRRWAITYGIGGDVEKKWQKYHVSCMFLFIFVRFCVVGNVYCNLWIFTLYGTFSIATSMNYIVIFQGGIAATISHLDFFSVPSQRLAFQIAANCALYVTANDFGHVRESLPELTQRLLIEVYFLFALNFHFYKWSISIL